MLRSRSGARTIRQDAAEPAIADTGTDDADNYDDDSPACKPLDSGVLNIDGVGG